MRLHPELLLSLELLVMHQGHGTGWLGSRARSGFQDLASPGGCVWGIRAGKVPVPTLGTWVRKGAPWYLLHGLLGVEGGIWEMDISTGGICPPLCDKSFSIHPSTLRRSFFIRAQGTPRSSNLHHLKAPTPPALPVVVLGDPNHPHGTSPWSPGLEGATWC